MRVVLENIDCEVRTITKNFEDALRPETWANIDIAFVDYMLGHKEITGEDVVAAGRRHRGSDVRIIMLSALSRELLSKELLANLDAHIQKPVDIETLQGLVQSP